ncbi:hypothetical protein ACP4OV_004574 [Aristida adscensionis]
MKGSPEENSQICSSSSPAREPHAHCARRGRPHPPPAEEGRADRCRPPRDAAPSRRRATTTKGGHCQGWYTGSAGGGGGASGGWAGGDGGTEGRVACGLGGGSGNASEAHAGGALRHEDGGGGGGGLDQAAIRMLLEFAYGELSGHGAGGPGRERRWRGDADGAVARPFDCVVCLSEFADDDRLHNLADDNSSATTVLLQDERMDNGKIVQISKAPYF